MKKGLIKFLYTCLVMVFGVFLAVGAVHAEDYWLKHTMAIDYGNNDSGEDVAVDADKNVYVAARLGDNEIEIDALVKYNGSGTMPYIEWTRDYDGGNVDAQIYAVAVDALGNAYVTGGTSLTEGGVCLTEAYAPAGTLLWSREFPPLGYTNRCHDIVVDAGGNIIVAGAYQPRSGASRALLLIKYDADGNELCSATTGWPLPTLTHAMAVDVDSAGNAYVLGHIDAPGYYGIFKYDSHCGAIGGAGPDIMLPTNAHIYTDMAVNENGIYVIGRGDHDVHLAKYSTNGTLLASTIYDGGDDFGNALALDSDGNVYAAGRAGGYLILKYDSSLDQLLWSGRWAEGTSDRALGIDVDKNDNIYVTGTAGGYTSNGLQYNAVTLIYSPGTAPDSGEKTK